MTFEIGDSVRVRRVDGNPECPFRVGDIGKVIAGMPTVPETITIETEQGLGWGFIPENLEKANNKELKPLDIYKLIADTAIKLWQADEEGHFNDRGNVKWFELTEDEQAVYVRMAELTLTVQGILKI